MQHAYRKKQIRIWQQALPEISTCIRHNIKTSDNRYLRSNSISQGHPTRNSLPLLLSPQLLQDLFRRGIRATITFLPHLREGMVKGKGKFPPLPFHHLRPAPHHRVGLIYANNNGTSTSNGNRTTTALYLLHHHHRAPPVSPPPIIRLHTMAIAIKIYNH